MTVRDQAVRYSQRRLKRRLAKSVPWVGGLIAIATIAGAVRRKGLFGGSLDTALNAIPFVGALKNVAEVARGRDFIRDKRVAGSELWHDPGQVRSGSDPVSGASSRRRT